MAPGGPLVLTIEGTKAMQFVTSVGGKISAEQARQFGGAVGGALETLRGYGLTEEEVAMMLLSTAYGHAKQNLHWDGRQFLMFCEHIAKCVDGTREQPLIVVPKRRV